MWVFDHSTSGLSEARFSVGDINVGRSVAQFHNYRGNGFRNSAGLLDMGREIVDADIGDFTSGLLVTVAELAGGSGLDVGF